jgi:MFS family permease
MGIIGAAFGIGFVIGPAIGGMAGHYFGPMGPGLLAAGLSLLNFGLALRILPESLAPEHRVQRPLIGFEHLGAALTRRAIRPLAAMWGLQSFAFAGYTVALPLFAAAAFGWRERELGIFFTLVGTIAAVVQGYLFGKLARRFGDRALLVAGAFGMTVGIGLVPLVGSSAQLYLWTVILAFSHSISMPAVNGLVSNLAAPHEQGAILGALQACAALGRFAGPEAIGGVYDAAGAVLAFVTAGVIMLAGAAIALRIARPSDEPATSPAAAPGG